MSGLISISIHVPAWGTTTDTDYSGMYGEISIHVPAWGTTKIYCNYGCLSAISIHVPAWGTTDGNVISGYPDEFQSTFPRGERQNLSRNIFLKEYFNPRSRVGNDWATWTQQARNKNFNPRSRVGNDTVQWNLELDCRISIHVPAWGTTISLPEWQYTTTNFNPRSRVGNDKV